MEIDSFFALLGVVGAVLVVIGAWCRAGWSLGSWFEPPRAGDDWGPHGRRRHSDW